MATPDSASLSGGEVEVEKVPTLDVGPPPDGGWKAWGQAALMHVVFLNTWGVANSFGIFQNYYTSELDFSQFSVSWIGSVQVFFLFFVGVAAGRATDAGHFRVTFALGVLLQLLGIFLTSLCTKYWQIFLAQGVCVGLGNGCTFCPALTVLSAYFHRNRAFAVGVGAAGAATGGLIYPVMVDHLLNRHHIGFPWTMRVVGLVMLATYVPCLVWFAPRLPPRKTGPWVDWSAFRELPFVFFATSMFFNFWGLYFAFFYLGTFARDIIGLAEPVNLIMVLNGVGMIGRIVPNIVASQWTGPLNTLVPMNLAAAVLMYCWIAVRSGGALYAFTVLFGLAAAAIQALFPATATTMTPHANRAGTRVGMIFTIVSFATLTGPAIAGVLIERDNGSYVYAQLFAGTSFVLGAFLAAASRLAKTGFVLRARA
ncbi:MFS general substrate transporter [Coniochaeta ligniaria NRRL 30616]|uniref:MFS general substrate transporter n=1 Tax=Coniochaeta ligniaria NRRL 30616 TaxID=1408157 RepID=A0A1J7IGT2_9PEZI|nr:MFS general substrate transporter [Coniochaeta ligniaria NRRL 30616]